MAIRWLAKLRKSLADDLMAWMAELKPPATPLEMRCQNHASASPPSMTHDHAPQQRTGFHSSSLHDGHGFRQLRTDCLTFVEQEVCHLQ